jgi:hypothetical protein
MKSAQRNARIRYLASRAVNIASLAFFVFSIVNMVHFLSGNSGSWLVDTMNASLPLHMTRTIEQPNATLPGVLLYYVYGVAGILIRIGAVLPVGAAVARIIEVGWAQFKQEEAKAAEEMALVAERDRRRQRRIARSAAEARRGGDADFMLFTAAFALFAWWLL